MYREFKSNADTSFNWKTSINANILALHKYFLNAKKPRFFKSFFFYACSKAKINFKIDVILAKGHDYNFMLMFSNMVSML